MSRIRKYLALFCMYWSAIFVLLVPVSMIWPDPFGPMAEGRVLVTALLMSLLALEITVERKCKVVYPLTLMAYGIVMLVMYFSSDFQLSYPDHVHNWLSILLIAGGAIATVVLGILSVLKRKK